MSARIAIIEALWLEEAQRRDRAMDAGEAPSIPAETVFANIRFRLESGALSGGERL